MDFVILRSSDTTGCLTKDIIIIIMTHYNLPLCLLIFLLETLIVDVKALTQEEKDEIERQKRMAEDEILARQLAESSGEGGAAAGGLANGILLKQVVAADNSCLFTSIGFLLSGKVDTTVGSYMREIIASTVHNEKEEYNDGILGRPNADYVAWIMQESSWGGAIEVSILSAHYGIEFDVVDITNAMIVRFGEDRKYPMRGFLLYDGIHYDPLYLESLSGAPQKTLFSVDEEPHIYDLAQSLAQEAKSSRQFTDTDNFTLRCIQCDRKLKGQKEATEHAKETGHDQFGEF
jgi:ubiquitin thioesterase OTU1